MRWWLLTVGLLLLILWLLVRLLLLRVATMVVVVAPVVATATVVLLLVVSVAVVVLLLVSTMANEEEASTEDTNGDDDAGDESGYSHAALVSLCDAEIHPAFGEFLQNHKRIFRGSELDRNGVLINTILRGEACGGVLVVSIAEGVVAGALGGGFSDLISTDFNDSAQSRRKGLVLASTTDFGPFAVVAIGDECGTVPIKSTAFVTHGRVTTLSIVRIEAIVDACLLGAANFALLTTFEWEVFREGGRT